MIVLSAFPYSVLYSLTTPFFAPANVNGRIVIANINSSKISVLLQINTNTGQDAMGGATMIIGFDTSAISFTQNPIKNTDYVFHNFCEGNYSPATVTRPVENRIWINIDLPFLNSNEGTTVAGGSSWTDVATIYFDVLDQEGLINIYWLCNSTFWGIYDDDNATFWNIGQFKDALNIPLPVELSSFSAKLLADKVEINWTTESEVNNYGFDVERKVIATTWIKLGFVSGSGNSNTPKTYSFIDDSLFGGSKFYYRLKQIDTDGSFEYSDIVAVEFLPQKFSLEQNYPNPFNPTTVISYQLPISSDVTLKVYDVLGNEVATLVDEYKPAGKFEVEFSAKGGSASGGNAYNFPSGVYFYQLNAGSFVETKKMILIK